MNGSEKILAIDIGGSHIKATVLDIQGNLRMDYKNVITPKPATPATVLAAIQQLVQSFPDYDMISVGFPGYIKEGKVITAPNLGTTDWKNVDLAMLISKVLGKPAKVINDADMQGYGIIKGKGLEMMVTLGTGFGTALFRNGILLPHLEMAHHPITKKQTYDLYIGQKSLNEIGDKKWNSRIKKVISILETVFNYDMLYIGGGNARKITTKLADNIQIVTNKDAVDGGAKLWV